jgi:hypothetical protein
LDLLDLVELLAELAALGLLGLLEALAELEQLVLLPMFFQILEEPVLILNLVLGLQLKMAELL